MQYHRSPWQIDYSAAQMELLRIFLNQAIIVNQVEFNLDHAHLLDEGIVFNQNNPRRTRNEGAMEYCRLHNITLQARGLLAAGRLTGRPRPNDENHVKEAAKLIMQMAAEKAVSP